MAPLKVDFQFHKIEGKIQVLKIRRNYKDVWHIFPREHRNLDQHSDLLKKKKLPTWILID